jgi:protein required for attachment to host cells
MLLPHGCAVALVDGESFDLYRNAGSEAEPQLLLLDPPELDSTNHSGGSHRSSPGSQVLRRRIKDLVILAAPRTLGEMRKHYHAKLHEVLHKEVSKDLGGFNPRDIMLALREER